jgi:hypothetical protein
VCKVASVCGFDLELPDNLPIDEVTKQAFRILGENGIIRCASDRSTDSSLPAVVAQATTMFAQLNVENIKVCLINI